MTSTPKFQARRFAKLIDAVAKTPPKRFNMGCWRMERDCGTVACAAGSYAITNPKCDLKLVNVACDDDVPSYDIQLASDNSSWGFTACANHFGIAWDESDHLFGASSYADPSKKHVLARLRKFYRDKTAQKKGKAA